MKIAHVGDVHWGLNYPGPSPDSRFNDISRTMDWVADRMIEEGCDLILFAGDAFKDARVFLDRASREIKVFADWLRKVTNSGAEVVVISGTPSHDAISAYHLIEEMKIPRVHIFTSPGIKEFNFTHFDINIACLPGMNRGNLVTQDEYRTLPPHAIHQIMTEKITETCQELLAQSGHPAILLTHLSYDMADKGFEDALMQHEPVLTQEAVDGFDLVCLGHIHRPQRNGNVFYCGSPERLSFNDEGIIPGFWIHEMVDNNFTTLVEYKESRFIETPARRFYTQEWNERDVDWLIQGGKLVDWVFKDAIIRVHCECQEETAKRLDRKALERALYEASAYYIHEIKVDVQRVDRARDQEVTESLGPVEAVGKWCQQREIESEETAALQAMTAELLKEVAA